MNTKSYLEWLKGLDQLTSHQQHSVLSRLTGAGGRVSASLEQAGA